MASKIFAVILSSFFYGSSHAEESKQHQNLYLDIGQSHTLRLPQIAQINLSRKGIVHAKKIDDENWVLIGLKQGYTLLQAEDGDRHYFVGIFIGKTPQSVNENNDEFEDELETKNHSKKSSNPEDHQRIVDLLRAHFPKELFNIQIIENEVHLQMPCMHSLVKEYRNVYQKIAKSMEDSVKIEFYCLPAKTENYSIEIFVTHLESAEEHSFDGEKLAKSLQARFRKIIPESISEEKSDSLISYPKLTFQIGYPAKFTSGGEFESHTNIRSTEESWAQTTWKRFGLEFSFEAHRLFDQKVLLTYESTLNVPSPMQDRLSVRGSNSSSQLLINEGEPTVAGVFDIISAGSLEQEQSFLARWPIVGPLFKKIGTSYKSSTIAFLIKIERMQNN